MLQDSAIGGVVVYYQNSFAGDIHGRCIDLLGFTRRKRQRKPETCAESWGALQANRSAHQLNQSFADGKAKPSAAEASGSVCLGLGEWLKQVRLRFRCNAHAGIAHFETKMIGPFVTGRVLHGDRNFTVFGKLDGIAEQISQHLANAGWVAFPTSRHSNRHKAV